jgi:ABC-2 type transport system permease protein
MAIAFLMPVILLFIFGFGVTLDAKHIPVAVVIEQPSPETAAFAGRFMRTPYLRPVILTDFRRAQSALQRREVQAIVRLRANFTDDLVRPAGTSVQVVVNGVDANTARIVQGYIEGVMAKWREHVNASDPSRPAPPVTVEHRIWFNSAVRSRNYLVPGLVAVIMTLIGTLLTALVMAREWERGTMETMFVTPVRRHELLLSKLIAYFVLGIGGMTLSVAMGILLFRVPFRGSYLVLFTAGSVFLLVTLGMGLLISATTKSQFVASQIAILGTFLPAFILSGFIFDIASMPTVVRVLTHVIPARYFVSILQTVFLAGNVWPIIIADILALTVMAIVLLGLTYAKSGKHL